ncbi:MAG: DoxX family protein, partial [candidate division KSB1 bacterium]|nr:DoxX family protein [candidate division KSB1 bacterium]
MKNAIIFVGRILLTLIFFLSGIQKIPNFNGTKQYMAAAGMPLTDLFLVAAIIIEIVGAILIFIGFKTKWAA